MKTLKRHPRGFTLLELLVVVAILAALAMVVLPKLEGLIGNANHAVSAAGADDTGRYIQIYRTTKLRYPDGYDSLMGTDGSSLWTPANPSTAAKGLHTQLSGTSAKLSTTTLTTDDLTALNNAGIYNLYNLGGATTATTRPGDMFNVQTLIASGISVPTVNAATTGGRKIIDHIYRDNLKSAGTSGTIAAGAANAKLVVFGFGPHNALIGHSMMETPSYANVDATLVYNRNLVIFEIVGTKATFKAVVGADGDLIDDMASSMSKDVN